MVLVSHDYQFVFLKPQKTAGTSVEMYLEPFCAPPDHVVSHYGPGLVSRHGVIAARGRKHEAGAVWTWRGPVKWRTHMAAAKVRKAIGRRRWNRYRRIATVRNPFDRMVSQYNWINKSRDPDPDLARRRQAFRDYVLGGDWSTSYDILHIDGQLVTTDVVRYERLEAELAALSTLLGLPEGRSTLPHVKNKQRFRAGMAVSDYFDAETRDAVCRRLGWMFDAFGYSTDPRDADAPHGPDSPANSETRSQPAEVSS